MSHLQPNKSAMQQSGNNWAMPRLYLMVVMQTIDDLGRREPDK
jgi:hypothetical protein